MRSRYKYVSGPIAQLVTCLPGGNGRQGAPQKLVEVYVYVLLSRKNNWMYVGMTTDIENRISEHNSGRVRSTKAYRPWKLLHIETLDDRKSAREREKYLKSGYGKTWLKNKY